MKYIILCLLIISIVVKANNCGGNCPGGCPNCPCGTSPNPVNVPGLCKGHSWNQNCCVCIVHAESGGNVNAMKYDKGVFYIGLFQISQIYWPSCSGGSPPCNPTTNRNCAIAIYKAAGNRWNPWPSASKCGCLNSP